MLQAHSGFRYLVLLLGILVIGYAAFGMATKRPYDKTMRILSAVFTGVIDVTVLLGLVNMFTGTFYPRLSGHISMMVAALVVAHLVSAVTKRRPPEQRTYPPHLWGALIVLGLVSFGIMAIGRPIVG